uniref:TBC1 domain family member 2B-like n=2 Tax=Hippocampus comes TaxID=109280 RepID=A0A3Q3DFF8_HIPCM
MHEEEDGVEPNSGPAPRFEASVKAVDGVDVEVPKEHTSKLCGFLSKLSGKGPLRGYKPRWFVYDPRKCYLYYFKSPQDALPLGHIEIGDACFSYDVEAEEGHFQISTAGKEFLLKAPSKQVMHSWLQQLQQKRWEFSNSRGYGQRDSWSSPTLAYPISGLVAEDNGTKVHTHTRALTHTQSDGLIFAHCYHCYHKGYINLNYFVASLPRQCRNPRKNTCG